ncbi:hypothetical protein QIS74_04606 [Colletotrichum tabaci]|uniref:Uncharacterized protein n=1 Tax=Colletotrichum tabaci TaxID=1209068 RepID=A0AAV9TL10_9PEZI
MSTTRTTIVALILTAFIVQASPVADRSLAIADGHQETDSRGLSVKRAKKVETKVTYGKTKIEYGCDASVHYTFKGLEELCAKGSNACDEGTPWSREVSWTSGNENPDETEITIKAEGRWYDEDERKNLIEAIMKTARTEEPATIEIKDKKWSGRVVGSLQPLSGTCKMTQFPNFVDVTVFEDEEPKSWMSVKVSLEAAEGVAGAIHGIAGAFFGTVLKPFCKNEVDSPF